MWNLGTILFVLVAIAVATGPVIYMTYHSMRYGHLASRPEALTVSPEPPLAVWEEAA